MKKSSKDLIGVSIGILFGESSWLEKFSLTYEHPITDMNYIVWKNDLLIMLSGKEVKVFNQETQSDYIDKYSTQPKRIIQAKLLHIVLVGYLKQLMYNADNKKIITKTALELITPLGIMLWYFDSGEFNYSQLSASISTVGFTLDENNLLKEWLHNNYNINVNIVKKSERQYLYFSKKETLKLLALIESNCKNIPICIRRKIPIGWKDINQNSEYKWNRIPLNIKEYDAKEMIKTNLLEYHLKIDQVNPNKDLYFNILGYKAWNDSYSIGKTIRRVFGSMNAALSYSNLPSNIC